MDRFIELYEHVYRKLYYLALYYTGDPYDAQDVLSETVLKAYESFASLRKEEAFQAWITRILVNQCKDYWHKKQTFHSLDDVRELSYEPSLEDSVLTRELLQILKEDDRRIVALSVFGGYKSREIAKILGLPHSTVRSKYRRALRKMEQQVLEMEVHYER